MPKATKPKKKRIRNAPLKASQRTPVTATRPKNGDLYTIDDPVQSGRRSKSQVVKHTLSNGRGRLTLAALSLRSDASVSWTWKAAPERLRRLKMQYPGDPQFITIVPRAMSNSHFPPTALEVFELADGYVCIE